jgi:hypothetical protein
MLQRTPRTIPHTTLRLAPLRDMVTSSLTQTMWVFTGHPGAFWLLGREIRPVSELRETHTQETREGEP